MSSATSTVFTLVASLSGLLGLGLAIALLVVVLTVVRRHRPDAWQLLAAASGLQIANIVFHFLANLARPFLSRAGGVDEMMFFQIVLTGVGMVESVIWYALLGFGIARLAQPPREQGGGTVGPYR